jgi:rod shape-determining protein MreC
LAVYRRSSRTRNVLAVLVLAALTLVTIDARSNGHGMLSQVRGDFSDAFSPLQRATHAALRPLGNFISGAANYGSLQKENQELRRQLAQAQSTEAAAAAERAEAEQVLKEQDLPFVGSIPTVTAAIIDIGSSNFDNTIIVDKGTDNGLADGQPVVAAGGLVGTVENASRHTASIQLLTDPSFTVGVGLQGGNVGSASGQGSDLPLKITVVSTNAPKVPDERVGQIVTSSGLALEKFPPAIPVGKVSKVSKPAGSIEPEIELQPLVNPASLGFVEIMLWSSQTAP